MHLPLEEPGARPAGPANPQIATGARQSVAASFVPDMALGTAATAKGAADTAKFLALVFNSIPNPAFVKDDNRQYVFFNDAFCELLGRTRAEIFGRTDVDIVSSEHANHIQERDDLVLTSGLPHEAEGVIVDITGKRHWVLFRITPLDLPSGRRGLVGVLSDLTRRRQMEVELREGREHLARAQRVALGSVRN